MSNYTYCLLDQFLSQEILQLGFGGTGISPQHLISLNDYKRWHHSNVVFAGNFIVLVDINRQEDSSGICGRQTLVEWLDFMARFAPTFLKNKDKQIQRGKNEGAAGKKRWVDGALENQEKGELSGPRAKSSLSG